MIPSSLKLTNSQKGKLISWYNSLPKQEVVEESGEESGECTPTSDVRFELYSTGIGDEIKSICYRNKKTYECCLTVDDDGNVITLSKDGYIAGQFVKGKRFFGVISDLFKNNEVAVSVYNGIKWTTKLYPLSELEIIDYSEFLNKCREKGITSIP